MASTREWLNLEKDGGIAFISTDLYEERHKSASGHIQIADCTRMVTLDFHASTTDGAENALHKLKTLRLSIAVFERKFKKALRKAGISTG